MQTLQYERGNRASRGISAAEWSGYTILVAEDSEMDAFILRKAFTMSGLPHRLLFVPDGEQAIKYLQSKPPYSDLAYFPVPDLFLLDLKMPRVDGFEVLQWMQKSGLHHIPVLVLSGSSRENDKIQAMQLGAREYHVKPAGLDAVVKFLKETSDRWLKAAR